VILFILLNVMDVSLTLRIIKKGGREINPILKKLMDKFGVVPALLVTKSLLIALVLSLDVGNLIWVLCAFYFLIVCWNVKVLYE
jgi:hypothetical protein